MTETVLEKVVCMSCAADVRDGTNFCYNCGKPVSNGLAMTEPLVDADPTEEIVPVLVKNEEKDAKTDRFAVAAAERKKSRVGQRKPKKVVWEEPSPSSNRIFVLFCVLITAIASALVFLVVFFK